MAARQPESEDVVPDPRGNVERELTGGQGERLPEDYSAEEQAAEVFITAVEAIDQEVDKGDRRPREALRLAESAVVAARHWVKADDAERGDGHERHASAA